MRNLTCGLLCVLSLTAACGGDDAVDSDEQARRAYLGLDQSIQKSIDLGFQGFNAASSANIDPQMTTGTKAGTLTITGQVDQGSSNNKGMRLRVGMVGYNDGPFAINDDGDLLEVVYDTDADVATQPALDLQLKNIPSGTLTGTLMGVYHLSNGLSGTLTLSLTISGMLQAGSGNTITTRVPGTTMVTGTATNADGGVYNISLSI